MIDAVRAFLQRPYRSAALASCALLAPCAMLSSCAGGLEFAAIGAAFQGTNFATAVYKQGRLSVVEEAEYALVEEAALKAVGQLDLTRRIPDTTPNDPSIVRRSIYVEDDADHEVTITVRRLTDRLTLLEVDVGAFGMEELVRIITLRIRTNLFEQIKAIEEGELSETPPPVGSTIPANPQ